MKHRALKYLPPTLGLLVLGGTVVGLHGALKRIGLGDVLAALAATPRREVAHALMLLAGSLCVMAVYDIPGVLFARRLAAFPRLSFRRIALASFCAYALSHVLGAAAISAAAIRLRLYAQWQAPPAGITRIIALSGSTFTLGFLSLLGGLLLVNPLNVPLFGHAVAPEVLRAAGAMLAGAIVFYVVAARRRPALVVFGRNIALPGQFLALAQVVLSCVDTTLACGILYVVLPDTQGLNYAHVLGVYLVAFAGGLFSGLPGGVGVFDSVLLLGLADYLPPATALGAILLFRVLYYLGPACAAALCYAGYEILTTTRGQRAGK